jgi:hypothetical protein
MFEGKDTKNIRNDKKFLGISIKKVGKVIFFGRKTADSRIKNLLLAFLGRNGVWHHCALQRMISSVLI